MGAGHPPVCTASDFQRLRRVGVEPESHVAVPNAGYGSCRRNLKQHLRTVGVVQCGRDWRKHARRGSARKHDPPQHGVRTSFHNTRQQIQSARVVARCTGFHGLDLQRARCSALLIGRRCSARQVSPLLRERRCVSLHDPVIFFQVGLHTQYIHTHTVYTHTHTHTMVKKVRVVSRAKCGMTTTHNAAAAAIRQGTVMRAAGGHRRRSCSRGNRRVWLRGWGVSYQTA